MRPLHDHYTPYGLANLEVDGGLSGTLASPWLRPLRCSGKTIRAHGWPRRALVSGRLARTRNQMSIVREFWGHGYATEAASGVLDMSARTLKRSRLISLILPDNERSKAVARRLGGEYEKTISFRDGKADIFAYRLGEQEQAAQ
jgi:hypothetical protein